MNIFWHELKQSRKSMFFWVLGMALFIAVSMAKYDSIAAASPQMFKQLISQFPATIQAVFGITGLDITTVSGYYGVCLLYFAVTLAIHAGLTGSGLIAAEQQDHTSEFLYAKPVGRTRIAAQKLLAGLVAIMLLWGTTVAVSYAYVIKMAGLESFNGTFWPIMYALLLTQLLFFTLGALLSAALPWPTAGGKIISGIIFVQYIIFVISKLAPTITWLPTLSVFCWFDAVDILSINGLNVTYVALTAALALLGAIAALAAHVRKDVTI